MARLCKHNVDLTQFNCEMCAREFASAHPADKKPWPKDPQFRVHHDGEQWVCELDNYTGTGPTIGRAIDAAITIGLGFGRSLSLRRWVRSHYYVISAMSTEVEESKGETN